MSSTPGASDSTILSGHLQLAALVLCGGQSRRMGAPKYLLPFGEETLLQRICRIVGVAASPVVIVAAENQSLTEAPQHCHVCRDSKADEGPLQAIADGLACLIEADREPDNLMHFPVFVTSCDVPLLTSGIIEFLAAKLQPDDDVIVIRTDDQPHPLCAVYRAGPALVAAQRLLAANVRRASSLPGSLRTRWVMDAELRTIDPQLHCLRNCNTPDELQEAILLARDYSTIRNT